MYTPSPGHPILHDLEQAGAASYLGTVHPSDISADDMTASINGYIALPHSGSPCRPQYYQSKSLLEINSQPNVIPGDSETDTAFDIRRFARYAKAHAYPKGILPSDTAFTKMRDGSLLLPPRDNVSTTSPTNLPPSLQAAAAKSLPPIISIADTMPPIAEIRPTTAMAASVPLPGPRDLIDDIAGKNRSCIAAAPLAFGSTTKIIPLPVTTTRPLPAVETHEAFARPAVILTAEEYSLQPAMVKSLHKSGEYQQSRIPSAFYISNSPSAGRTYDDRTSEFKFPAQAGPDFISAIGNLSIPPGFTSVNPPGRSRGHVKKKHSSYESNNKPADIDAEYKMAKGGSGDQQPSGTYRKKSPVEEASPVPRPDQKTFTKECYGQEEETRESMVKVGEENEQAKRPRGRPPGSKTKKRKRAESDPDEVSDLESGPFGGKAMLLRIKVSRRLSRNSVLLTVEQQSHLQETAVVDDRPAICSLNPAHPLYQERLQRGELPEKVVCDKRFARNSDRVRHERTHCDDRYEGRFLDPGNSFS